MRLREFAPGPGIIEEARIPRSIEEFLDSLSPDDVGVEEFGNYRIHYEGFTDNCKSSRDYRQNPDAVYDQVFADFVAREGGRKPLVQDMVGDERYPILYSIFKIPRQVREFAPSPDRDHNDDVPDPIFVLANRWWNATDRQPQIEHVLNSLGWSIHQVESEDDAVQLQHRDGTTHFISADDFDPDLFEYSQLKPQRAHRDGIDLSFEKIKDDEYVDDDDNENTVAQVTATSNGKELGHVLFSIDGDTLLPQDLEVDERYRGQGIAKIMYDYVKSLGYQIRRSGQQTDAGAGFWSKHRPAQNVWETELDEIAKIPQGDFGDKDTLAPMATRPKTTPLPGGGKFSYAVNKKDPENLEIMIFDGDTLAAELDLFYTRDATKAWRVETVAVDPDYRSQGLGKALYGIALSILRLTVEAGDTQTKYGQRMWLMLNSIPGVEVMGYNMERTPDYKPGPNDKIISQDKNWTKYTFPVRPGVNSMRSARRGTGMYTSQASMIAKWTGS